MSEGNYKYQVGDTGLLKNGEDTYRIVANDVVTMDDNPLLALVIAKADEGYPVNVNEQVASFNAAGESGYYQFGGNSKGNLVPPATPK